jgi:uncharacterized protein (DUF488 family)
MSGKPTSQTRLGEDGVDFYTIGYEKLKVEDLFTLLRQAGVHCLVDVRDTPWSRVPAYRKNALESQLAELSKVGGYDVRYVSMPELVNPKEIRESDRSGTEMMTVYRQHVLSKARELEELYNITKKCKSAVLCYEADPAECHRSVLAAIMADKYGLKYADLRM